MPSLAVLGLCGACARAAPPAREPDPDLLRLRAELSERDLTIQQLEGKLALLEASQRQLRAELDAAHSLQPAIKASVRIGAHKTPVEPAQARESASEQALQSELQSGPASARPMLRLAETPAGARPRDDTQTRAAAPVPRDDREFTSTWQAPDSAWKVPSTSDRLTVAPLPKLSVDARGVARERNDVEARAGARERNGAEARGVARERNGAEVRGRGDDAARPAPSADIAGERYVRALDLLRRREFVEALRELDAFVHSFPDDPRCTRALFWSGEILFAERSYARALSSFEQVLARSPHGERAADAWLRIARCHKRLGAPALARAAITKLKAEFPESEAARLAEQVMQEDSG